MALFLALLLAAFLAAIPLALVFRDIVRETLVIPFLYVLWRVGIFLRGFDTVLWWALFLAAALYLFLRSMERSPAMARRTRIDRPDSTGRVTFWLTQIERADHSDYARWQLEHGLVQVALELMDRNEDAGEGRLGQTPDISELGAPPDVRAFLESGLNRPFDSPIDRVSRWLHRSNSGSRVPAPQSDLERVIAFLEEQMET